MDGQVVLRCVAVATTDGPFDGTKAPATDQSPVRSMKRSGPHWFWAAPGSHEDGNHQKLMRMTANYELVICPGQRLFVVYWR